MRAPRLLPGITDLCDEKGVLLRRDAIEMGVDDNALARLTAGKILRRVRQGLYVDHAVWESADAPGRHLIMCHGVLRLYGGEGVVLSHASACLLHGGPTWGLDLGSVDLTHLCGAGRRQSRVRHHHGVVRVTDLRRHGEVWTVVPARAVLEVAAAYGTEVGLVQADHFLRSGMTTGAELARLAEVQRHWPGGLCHRMVVHLADGRHESPLETRTGYLFHRQGLPPVVAQYEVYDRGRFLGRVDFAWPDQRVVVEVDGREKYHRYRRPGESIEEMVLREKAREDAIREAGWTVIRLVWRDLEDPRGVARRVRRALGLRTTGLG